MANVRDVGLSNGMLVSELGEVTWRKSCYSNSTGNCVEFAVLGDDLVGIRDSKHPEGPVLVFTSAEVAAWLEDLRSGGIDDLLAGDAGRPVAATGSRTISPCG